MELSSIGRAKLQIELLLFERINIEATYRIAT